MLAPDARKSGHFLVHIQARRFDLETLEDEALSLAKQADNGPTFFRHKGRTAYVVLTEAMFDALWQDPHRAWAVGEMPIHQGETLMQALQATIEGIRENERSMQNGTFEP